jgi:hypothetical protein
MAYPDDLIEFARQMAELHPVDAHQPSLRRAVSTAYYALFHLLIADAVAYCGDPQLKAVLARMFDHGSMKSASDTKVAEIRSYFKIQPPSGPEGEMQDHLKVVAEAFSKAQQNRLDADYNLLREWQPNQVLLLIEAVERAFASWKMVRSEAVAKDYLFSMLPTRDRKQPQIQKPRPT